MFLTGMRVIPVDFFSLIATDVSESSYLLFKASMLFISALFFLRHKNMNVSHAVVNQKGVTGSEIPVTYVRIKGRESLGIRCIFGQS